MGCSADWMNGIYRDFSLRNLFFWTGLTGFTVFLPFVILLQPSRMFAENGVEKSIGLHEAGNHEYLGAAFLIPKNKCALN